MSRYSCKNKCFHLHACMPTPEENVTIVTFSFTLREKIFFPCHMAWTLFYQCQFVGTPLQCTGIPMLAAKDSVVQTVCDRQTFINRIKLYVWDKLVINQFLDFSILSTTQGHLRTNDRLVKRNQFFFSHKLNPHCHLDLQNM